MLILFLKYIHNVEGKRMYKKWLFLTISLIVSLSLVACVSNEKSVSNEEQKEKTVQEKAKKEPVNMEINVNKELKFKKFDVNVKQVKVYEKKGKLLADIKLNWTNKANDYGDKMTLFVATIFEVKQDGNELEEIHDAWNPENKKGNDVFFPNALGGNTDVKLTYELSDKKTPIEITFTPTTETENSETVIVEIPE